MARSATIVAAQAAALPADVGESVRRPAQIDLATLVGLLSGFGLVGAAVWLGGSAAAFVSVPSMLIVAGGTFAVTLASFSRQEFVEAWHAVRRTIRAPVADPTAETIRVLRVAQAAREHGVLPLQAILPQLHDAELLGKGLMMAMDGMPEAQIEELMRRELKAVSGRQARAASVLRKCAEVSPAMGLIGTLVGLVQMLGQLDDPAAIGPSMAVALLTTFYGALLANMLFSPLATKLERNAEHDELVNQIYVAASTSIARRENPRRLEMRINTMLSPSQRVFHFD